MKNPAQKAGFFVCTQRLFLDLYNQFLYYD